MAILDANGRPFPIAPPRPLDVGGATQIRDPAQRWSQSIGRVFPEKVASLLLAANQGDSEAYLTLAIEAEERYGHYASVLQTRKLAVVGECVEVAPGDKTQRAARIASDFEEAVVKDSHFADLLLDLLDGIAKGYSCVQPHWDTTTRPWTFSRFEHWDPRLFVFDRATLSEVRLRDNASYLGTPIPPGQFIIHRPRTRTGVPLRTGIIRPIVIAWMFQSASVAQWATFCEVFGMPLRIGRYDSVTITQPELDQLRTALINIGHDAAAMIPRNVDLEILDGRRPTSGDNVFEGLAAYWDRITSKIVVGATMTADDGSSLGQAKVHNEVRLDIKRADARALCATLREQLIAPWTFYNYGPTGPIPEISINVEPPEDLQAFSAAITPLIKAGLRVPAQPVREKFGLEAPVEGDEVIEPPAPTGPGSALGGPQPPGQ